MIKHILKTLSYVDWSFALPFLGPIGVIIGYRLGLRSKKKDSIVQIINEIREISINYINNIFERLHNGNTQAARQSHVQVIYLNSPNPDKFIKDIDLLMLRNGHLLGLLKRWKIKSTIKKIANFSIHIYEDQVWNREIHNKYRTQFYKYLNSIKIYD